MLSILQFIGAAFCVLVGIGLLVGGTFIGGLLGGAAAGGEGGAAGMGIGFLLGALGGVVFLVFAVLHVVVAWGMWTLKNWARMITLILAAIGAVFQVFGLLGSLLDFSLGSLLYSIVVLGINGAIVWYLIQPHVKAAFEGAPVQVRAAGM